mmetsp:Transcript_2671/g.6273  ORF Transcript_2671/g.6273 Transcript_2671/m.6273 type:complete len:411 (+) Transcript_2671:308-1540(+)
MAGVLALVRALASLTFHWVRIGLLEGGFVRSWTAMAIPAPLSVSFLRAECKARPCNNQAGHALAEVESADEENLDGSRVGVKGVNGETSRLLVVSGSDPDETLHYIVKRPPPLNSDTRQVSNLQRWGERECRFYTELAPLTPCRTPQCALASMRNGGNYVLVLEELMSTEWSTHHESQGLNVDQAAAALESIGTVHKYFRGNPELDRSWLPVLPVQLPLVPILVDHLKKVWPIVKDLHHEDIPEEIVDKVDDLAQHYEELSNRIAAAPRTLLHGDFRAENMRFRSSSSASGIGTATGSDMPQEVAVFDWAMCSKGNGVYDFVYLLSLSLSAENRRAWEPKLTKIYCDAAGIANDQHFQEQKRVAVLLIFTSYIFGAPAGVQDPAMKQTHTDGFRSLCDAIHDWFALELLS